jgi:hypothetical protein
MELVSGAADEDIDSVPDEAADVDVLDESLEQAAANIAMAAMAPISAMRVRDMVEPP